MHVMVFGSEALALELETSLKPGIEVVVLGSPIDSAIIDGLLLVVSPFQYINGEMLECIQTAKERLNKDALVKIVIV